MVCEQATNEERARAVSLLRLPIVLYGPSIRLCCKNDEEIKRSMETFLVSFRRPVLATSIIRSQISQLSPLTGKAKLSQNAGFL